jgi:Zn/Cd-binding protein ZinT
MNNKSSNVITEVFARYVTRNGRIIYPKKAKFFHFYIKTAARKSKI